LNTITLTIDVMDEWSLDLAVGAIPKEKKDELYKFAKTLKDNQQVVKASRELYDKVAIVTDAYLYEFGGANYVEVYYVMLEVLKALASNGQIIDTATASKENQEEVS